MKEMSQILQRKGQCRIFKDILAYDEVRGIVVYLVMLFNSDNCDDSAPIWTKFYVAYPRGYCLIKGHLVGGTLKTGQKVRARHLTVERVEIKRSSVTIKYSEEVKKPPHQVEIVHTEKVKFVDFHPFTTTQA